MREETIWHEVVGALVLSLVTAATVYTPEVEAAPPSLRIPADEVDLTSDDTTAQVLDRMTAAARTVCGQLSPLDQWTRHARAQCVFDTLEHAVRQAREPRLAAAHLARVRSGALDAHRDLVGEPLVTSTR